jgi:glycerol-3-phosphate dehydrogenase (NAD(P)+)
MISKPIAIAGNGGWGTAVALLLAGKGFEVRMWGIDSEYVRETARTRENPRYLPGVRLPANLLVTDDFAKATADAGLIVSAIPTQFLRETWAMLRPTDRSAMAPILSLSKGIEVKTLTRPTQILRDVTGRRRLAVLVGPSHAEEVARGLPAAVVVASRDEAFAAEVQKIVSTDRFRAYTNTDVLGVELASALKNVLAIAAGICDGRGLGDNAKSALLTRGVVEIARLGVALGANRQTFYGLAGIGDIITTCVSPHGRNRAVGERIGRGEQVRDVLASMTQVAEGVPTTKAAYQLSKKHKLEMPITEQIYRILYNGKSPSRGLTDLMSRAHRAEVEEYR